jgi:hypothetical protein
MGEFSVMCTGILVKVVHFPNRDVNDHYDAMIWRTYWKWLSAVQLLGSEGYLIELALARCLCWEAFMSLVCTPLHVQAAQVLWPPDYTVYVVLPLALGKQQLHPNILLTLEHRRNSYASTEMFSELFSGQHLVRCFGSQVVSIWRALGTFSW